MTARRKPPGSIITFFSYKGGVGRTMALANAGFLAAMGGKRVLLMDWDLEAPGLAYYFRGMVDHGGADGIRKAPGVLNLLWRWVGGIEAANNTKQLESYLGPFRDGTAFADCAQPLVQTRYLPKDAKLDFIGAGSSEIEGCNTPAYADALQSFSWGDFFDINAGGALIESLRDWCRAEYDVILIDSRTGLNDVAGICTMQLPDTVLLCFVLNRQNIEGIAQVAAAVKQARGDEIALRISPMRVSRDRPTEEADARARAQRQLERAGLQLEQVEEDMERLAVPVATVPFYETLAPFVPTDPALDPLTLCYQQLTEVLTGVESERVRIDPAWREEVRRRLEPKLTSIEYLESLHEAEPNRARDEIERYVAGALDADPILELDRDYVEALIQTALSVQDLDWEGDEAQSKRIGELAIALLRRLNTFGGGEWRIPLIDAMQEFDIQFGRSDVPRFAEYEEILSEGPQTIEVLIRRITILLAQARIHLGATPEAALMATDAARALLNAMPADDPEARSDLILNDAEIAEVRYLALRDSKHDEAEAEARRALHILELAPATARGQALRATFHMHLARRAEAAEACQHILEAARAWPRAITRELAAYKFAVDTLLAGPAPGQQSEELIERLFNRGPRGSTARHRSIGTPLQFTNAVDDFIQFAKTNEKLALAIGELGRPSTATALGLLADLSASGLLRRMRRPPTRTPSRAGNEMILKRYARLYDIFASYGAAPRPLALFGQVLADFDKWRADNEG